MEPLEERRLLSWTPPGLTVAAGSGYGLFRGYDGVTASADPQLAREEPDESWTDEDGHYWPTYYPKSFASGDTVTIKLNNLPPHTHLVLWTDLTADGGAGRSLTVESGSYDATRTAPETWHGYELPLSEWQWFEIPYAGPEVTIRLTGHVDPFYHANPNLAEPGRWYSNWGGVNVHAVSPEVTVQTMRQETREPWTNSTGTQASAPAVFRVTRPAKHDDVSWHPPLEVPFEMSGQARQGEDYVLMHDGEVITGSVIIQPDVNFADVLLVPLEDQNVETTETAVITLARSAHHRVPGFDQAGRQAVAHVVDSSPTVSASPTQITVGEEKRVRLQATWPDGSPADNRTLMVETNAGSGNITALDSSAVTNEHGVAEVRVRGVRMGDAELVVRPQNADSRIRGVAKIDITPIEYHKSWSAPTAIRNSIWGSYKAQNAGNAAGIEEHEKFGDLTKALTELSERLSKLVIEIHDVTQLRAIGEEVFPRKEDGTPVVNAGIHMPVTHISFMGVSLTVAHRIEQERVPSGPTKTFKVFFDFTMEVDQELLGIDVGGAMSYHLWQDMAIHAPEGVIRAVTR